MTPTLGYIFHITMENNVNVCESLAITRDAHRFTYLDDIQARSQDSRTTPKILLAGRGKRSPLPPSEGKNYIHALARPTIMGQGRVSRGEHASSDRRATAAGPKTGLKTGAGSPADAASTAQGQGGTPRRPVRIWTLAPRAGTPLAAAGSRSRSSATAPPWGRSTGTTPGLHHRPGRGDRRRGHSPSPRLMFTDRDGGRDD